MPPLLTVTPSPAPPAPPGHTHTSTTNSTEPPGQPQRLAFQNVKRLVKFQLIEVLLFQLNSREHNKIASMKELWKRLWSDEVDKGGCFQLIFIYSVRLFIVATGILIFLQVLKFVSPGTYDKYMNDSNTSVSRSSSIDDDDSEFYGFDRWAYYEDTADTSDEYYPEDYFLYESELNAEPNYSEPDPFAPDPYSSGSYSSNTNYFDDELGCPDGCTYHKDGCDIKGNISYNSGEKIYHLPGQDYYSETVINSKYGERWFCTEEEAIDNGWRKAWD